MIKQIKGQMSFIEMLTESDSVEECVKDFSIRNEKESYKYRMELGFLCRKRKIILETGMI